MRRGGETGCAPRRRIDQIDQIDQMDQMADTLTVGFPLPVSISVGCPVALLPALAPAMHPFEVTAATRGCLLVAK